MDQTNRKLWIVAKPPDRPLTVNGQPASRLIGNQHCYGGEQAHTGFEEAVGLLASGHVVLRDDEALTPQEQAYLQARCDPTWPRLHGRYPTFAEFT